MNPTLFDAPIAHTADPATSQEAAETITRSGKRQRHAATVLTIVQRHPGRTACELYDLATEFERAELREMQELRRRLTDLESAGLVRKGATKICTVRETRMVTWLEVC